MDVTDFYDFKALSKQIKIFEVEDQGNKVNWNMIRSISIKKEDPNALYIKYYYDGATFRVDMFRCVRVRLRKSDNQNQEIGQPEVLKRKRGITKNKKKDLLKLCEDALIPAPYHGFFQGLPIGSMVSDDDDDENNE